MSSTDMNRYRFHADAEDYRPVSWPPPGPFWCSGSGEDYSIVVAFANTEKELKQFWPEASEITVQEHMPVVFTDRFPKPDWWPVAA